MNFHAARLATRHLSSQYSGSRSLICALSLAGVLAGFQTLRVKDPYRAVFLHWPSAEKKFSKCAAAAVRSIGSCEVAEE